MSLPNYSPQGVIRLGCVPWDDSYKHVRLYSTLAEQQADILSLMQRTLDGSGYKYIARNRVLQVSIEADKLYHVNYCMYRNDTVTDGWIYCFITDVKYINDNTTQLRLETDIFQTFLMGTDWTVPPCFVEREHVDDDTIGRHINPEPPMGIDYKTWYYNEFQNEGRYVVLMVNAYPHYNQAGTAASGSDPISGSKYQNQFNACKMLVYDTLDANSMTQLEIDLDSFNGVGAADTICDAFMASALSLGSGTAGGYIEQFRDWRGNRVGVWQVKAGVEPRRNTFTLPRPTSLDGYVPHNNKLFTYPYCFAELGDWSGRTSDFLFEYASADDQAAAQITFAHSEPITSNLTAYVWPLYYNGAIDNRTPLMFTADMSDHISWVFSTYQNWAAQNSVVNQLAVIGSVGAATLGVMPGINAAVNAMQAGSMVQRFMSSYSGIMTSGEQMVLGMAQGRMQSPGEAFVGNVGAAAAGGAAGLAGTLGNVDRMSRVPNTARGATGGNGKFQIRKAGFYARSVTLLEEYARIMDTFFDMFGYQIDQVKSVDVNSRPNWNFVKTSGCAAKSYNTAAGTNAPFTRGRGTPSDVLAAIRACFDSGITFWHTTSGFGDYSLNNSL